MQILIEPCGPFAQQINSKGHFLKSYFKLHKFFNQLQPLWCNIIIKGSHSLFQFQYHWTKTFPSRFNTDNLKVVMAASLLSGPHQMNYLPWDLLLDPVHWGSFHLWQHQRPFHHRSRDIKQAAHCFRLYKQPIVQVFHPIRPQSQIADRPRMEWFTIFFCLFGFFKFTILTTRSIISLMPDGLKPPLLWTSLSPTPHIHTLA